ncbi:S-adenosyl-L-methionine-dependent methyltransferase [Globomyces pollinis-pini]|nr:S-adenosyl-L-methionine-dependent methyltransferase [Globomyces pollinis-pini]
MGIQKLKWIHSTTSLSNIQNQPSFNNTKSVDEEEMKRFSITAKEWWNPNGPYAVLHRMNPVRINYIRKQLELPFISTNTPALPFKDRRILDIGCGGGFLSQSLARLGAKVTAVDANLENIQIAKSYNRSKDINFIHTTAESLLENGELFDAVCALEVIEHVTDPKEFVSVCKQLVKPDGYIFFSTINRTPLAYLGTILLAEQVLNWVPKGTHTFDKYVTPNELKGFCNGFDIVDVSGMGYNPVTREWSVLNGNGFGDLEMNYIMVAKRPSDEHTTVEHSNKL